MSEQFVSIIVPAYNAEKTIKKCVDSLLSIEYPHYEIIIVDDGSSDATKEILQSYGNKIFLIENQHSGPSKCRNDAAKKAQGDFLAFTDSDCIVDRYWISQLLIGFNNEKIVSTGGSQFSPSDESNFGKLVQEFFEISGIFGGYIKPKGSNGLIKVAHNPSCNAMYRKEAYLAVGGFKEDLWPSEDVELDYRLKKKGYEFMYNSAAIVYHYRSQSLNGLSKMMIRYGKSMGILTREYGFFRRIQIVPLLLIVSLGMLYFDIRILLFVPCLLLAFVLQEKSFYKGIIMLFFIFLSFFIWNYGFFCGVFIKRKSRGIESFQR